MTRTCCSEFGRGLKYERVVNNMPQEDGEDTVPYTQADRLMQKETHDSVLRMETIITEMVRPRLDGLEQQVKEVKTIHRADMEDVDGELGKHGTRLDKAEGGLGVLRWGIATLIALLGVLVAVAGALAM